MKATSAIYGVRRSMDDGSLSRQTILDIRKVTLSYGRKTVVRDFSLTLKRGEKVILAGPNGAGKTTILRSIIGIISPLEGIIWKAGGIKCAYLKQGEAETTAPLSVREVVAMGLYKAEYKDKSRIETAMEITGVKHLASRSFSSISGGERQRAEIALCIAREADLVLMDEPSTFLDVQFRDELGAILKDLPSTMAVVCVTHDEILTEKLGWTVINTAEGEVRCKE